MKRVILVVWGFEAYGGMERHVCELALALHAAGLAVAVVSEMPVARSNYYATRLRAGGVALHAPTPLLRFANGMAIAARRSAAQRLIHGGGPLSRRLRRTLARLTQPGRGDVLHVHGCRLGQSWLIGWARARQIATVYTEHVAIAESGGPLVTEGLELVLSAGALACVSDQSRASLATLLPQTRPIAVTGHVTSIAPPPDRAVISDMIQLLCVTRFEPRKGIDTLLRALVTVRDRGVMLQVTLLGSGPLLPAMRRLARELALDEMVHFAGQVPPDRVGALMRQADAIAIPSRSEGLPVTLLEAMAGGKAIVATRAGGIPEVLIDRRNGLLVPVDDATALAAAIIELAEDRALRDSLGRGAFETWEQGPHRPARVVPAMLALYRTAEAAC